MSIFFGQGIVEELSQKARGVSPEFFQGFENNFLVPYLNGSRFYNTRKAVNIYLHMAVGMLPDSTIDQIEVRRCLSDSGNEGVWLEHIGRDIFPLLAKYRTIPHWNNCVPSGCC